MKADPQNFIIEPLGQHDRAAFSCGQAPLDAYIREQASQDVKRNLARVFVLVSKHNPQIVLAYYALSSRELRLDQLPEEIGRKSGRYNRVGVTLLGRMAADKSQKGKGLGELVLVDALKRSLGASREVASFAVFVEATNEGAAAFYEKFGFLRLLDDRLKLFLPMKTIEQL